MHGWSTFGAWTNHGHTRTHKTHHGLDLGEVNTFPVIILSMISHKGYIQMAFCPRTPNLGISNFPKLGLWALWKAITSYADLWLRQGLKQSCSPRWDLFNDMWHVFKGDSRFLVVENQNGILTLKPYFGHNLCFKYSNGSCKPISNI